MGDRTYAIDAGLIVSDGGAAFTASGVSFCAVVSLVTFTTVFTVGPPETEAVRRTFVGALRASGDGASVQATSTERPRRAEPYREKRMARPGGGWTNGVHI